VQPVASRYTDCATRAIGSAILLALLGAHSRGDDTPLNLLTSVATLNVLPSDTPLEIASQTALFIYLFIYSFIYLFILHGTSCSRKQQMRYLL
jgi:hypothetical protein